MTEVLQRLWRSFRKIDYWTWCLLLLVAILVLYFTAELWMPHWSRTE